MGGWRVSGGVNGVVSGTPPVVLAASSVTCGGFWTVGLRPGIRKRSVSGLRDFPEFDD